MPRSTESWQEYRARMLTETAEYIERGLADPSQHIPIPAKPITQGPWPQEVADWFWATVLIDRPKGPLGRWKAWLTSRSRHIAAAIRRR